MSNLRPATVVEIMDYFSEIGFAVRLRRDGDVQFKMAGVCDTYGHHWTPPKPIERLAWNEKYQVCEWLH